MNTSRTSSTPSHAFALVVGSGFAGSLMAWVLAKAGREVVLVDRGTHPRFAIGESSTPTADFLLAYLAQRWGLSELAPLAAFGTWQSHVPQLGCGLKRGFSYFGHSEGQVYCDDAQHSHSLLVAASASDAWSDTHWLRADVDAWFASQAVSSGARLHEQTEIQGANWDASSNRWDIALQTNEGAISRVQCQWLIDASGHGRATERWCGHREESDWMRTRSSALYGHFEGVASFSALYEAQFSNGPEIFNADDAAQHHLARNGWFWMLRFLGGRTSVGFVNAFPGEQPSPPHQSHALRQKWDALTQRYPSVARLLAEARLIDPRDGEQRPVLHYVHRMSRCRSHACGKGWVCLPVAAGFVDPLHSFGIAHSLSGIVRIAEGLLGSSTQQRQWLETYSQDVRREIDWFDLLISGSYRGLPSDRRFMAYAAFYFAAAIAFEKQMASDPSHWPTGYMSAADERLRAVAQDAWMSMGAASDVDDEKLIERMRTAIGPWNDVGLLEPAMRNRLDHTAPPKRMAMMLSGMAGA